MGQEIRRLARLEGKVFLLQDVRQFPFTAIKDEKHRVTTKKFADMLYDKNDTSIWTMEE